MVQRHPWSCWRRLNFKFERQRARADCRGPVRVILGSFGRRFRLPVLGQKGTSFRSLPTSESDPEPTLQVRQAQPARWMLLAEDHILVGTVESPPLRDTAPQFVRRPSPRDGGGIVIIGQIRPITQHTCVIWHFAFSPANVR